MSKKVYVVTGGSSGIGLAVIKKLINDPSHHVISFSRSKEKIERALLELGEIPDNLEFYEGNVCNEDECRHFSKFVKRNHNFINGLVNAAGVLTQGGIENITYAQWKYNLDVNLNGPYLFTQNLLPLLKSGKEASIVNVSSIASMRPGRSVAYSVSKAGLDMFTEFLAGELAPYKIRVNSVNPGFIRTNIHFDNQIVNSQEEYEAMAAEVARRNPLGRAGEADEVADLIIYLLNDKSLWITGSILKIDGGTLIENDFLPINEKS
jgi:NAD(P)-dependent dehydrogenase (short-subunit alcohol dehydrogenase family)